MRAITVQPGQAGREKLEDVPEPAPSEGSVLVETLAVGVCGTDVEILSGKFGQPPPGKERLVLGHEAVGRVLEAPGGSGLSRGDVVVGIVRRPDPIPCRHCAAGEWDMCTNGLYTEHGIKGLDGFAAERYRSPPEFLVKLDPALAPVGMLLETASVVAKAWEHLERIGARALWAPKRVLVTGAGPVGLLAAMMGAQRGLEVHVLDRVEGGPKQALVAALGAEYHVGDVTLACAGADVVLECTGVGQLVFDVMSCIAPGGIVCLTGISSGGRSIPVDMGLLNRAMVLENNVVFGSVNANRRHYEKAAEALGRADRGWLERIITRRVPVARWMEALTRHPDDVKPVIQFQPV